MKFDDLDIEYRLSPRRKSIGIMVTTEGKVVVTLPRGTSKESLAQALTKHRAWIEAKVAERQAAWGRLQGGGGLLSGTALPAHRVLRGARGRIPERERNQGASPGPGRSLVPPAAWYREQALRLLQERVSHFGAHMGLKPGPVVAQGVEAALGRMPPRRHPQVQLAPHHVPAGGHRLRGGP